MQLNLSQDDITTTVQIVDVHFSQWSMDRLQRMSADWMKNVLMYRNVQVLDWHEQKSGHLGRLMAWYQGFRQRAPGRDDPAQGRFIHPVTLMLGQTFIGNMSREVPRPWCSRRMYVLADLTTAEAAQDAIGIIERRNGIRQMTRGEFEFLYLYGSYFKYTRGVLDGRWSGYDTQPVLGEMTIGFSTAHARHGVRQGRSVPRLGPAPTLISPAPRAAPRWAPRATWKPGPQRKRSPSPACKRSRARW